MVTSVIVLELSHIGCITSIFPLSSINYQAKFCIAVLQRTNSIVITDNMPAHIIHMFCGYPCNLVVSKISSPSVHPPCAVYQQVSRWVADELGSISLYIKPTQGTHSFTTELDHTSTGNGVHHHKALAPPSTVPLPCAAHRPSSRLKDQEPCCAQTTEHLHRPCQPPRQAAPLRRPRGLVPCHSGS